jgi:undecaprenyl-diphosphatase
VQTLVRLDRYLTCIVNRTADWRGVGAFFAAVSWLGDGKFWYALMLVLPVLHGTYGLRASGHVLAVGLATLACYKVTKGSTRRLRPGVAHPDVRLVVAPLDEYSFPSGHTMHAVAFTCVFAAYFPALLVPLAVFSVLVAVSRVVLGLHYPTDVLLGFALGLALGRTGLALTGL